MIGPIMINLKLIYIMNYQVNDINNSFGFTGQITDYPKEVFASNFPKFINFEENKETIFVWS